MKHQSFLYDLNILLNICDKNASINNVNKIAIYISLYNIEFYRVSTWEKREEGFY